MTQRTKFEGCLLVLFLSASLAASSFAQRPDPSDRPPQQAVAAPHQDPSNRPPQQSTPPPASPQQGTPPKQPSGGSHQDQAPVSHDDRPPARSGIANPSSGRNSVHQPVDSNRPPVNRVDPNRPPSNRPTDPIVRPTVNIHAVGKIVTTATEITSKGSAPKIASASSRISNAFGNCLRNSNKTCATANMSGSK